MSYYMTHLERLLVPLCGLSLLSTKQKRGSIGDDQYSPFSEILNLLKGLAHPTQACRSPLVPLKQIPRVHLVRHVRELVVPAVGDDHVTAGLEGPKVVGNLGAEELRRVQRGLVDRHGRALGLHALHDALDGARAEVVGADWLH